MNKLYFCLYCIFLPTLLTQAGCASNPPMAVIQREVCPPNSYCEYHPNGRLELVAPLNNNGKWEGIVKSYDLYSRLYKESPFRNDKQEGLTKNYDESGALRQETPFRNGKVEGQMKAYLKDGKLHSTITYRNDSPVSGVCNNRSRTPWTRAELANWANGITVNCPLP